MYILLYKLDQLIRQIAVLVHQAPDPAVAAEWCIRELAGRMGIKVVLSSHWLSSSARLEAAGSEVLDALRTGLADEKDVAATREAGWRLLDSLAEELMAYDLSNDDDDVGVLERGWGEMAMP